MVSGGADDCEADQRWRTTGAASQGLEESRPLHTVRDSNIEDVKIPRAVLICKDLEDRIVCNFVREHEPGTNLIEPHQRFLEELGFCGGKTKRPS